VKSGGKRRSKKPGAGKTRGARLARVGGEGVDSAKKNLWGNDGDGGGRKKKTQNQKKKKHKNTKQKNWSHLVAEPQKGPSGGRIKDDGPDEQQERVKRSSDECRFRGPEIEKRVIRGQSGEDLQKKEEVEAMENSGDTAGLRG